MGNGFFFFKKKTTLPLAAARPQTKLFAVCDRLAGSAGTRHGRAASPGSLPGWQAGVQGKA